MIFKDRDDKSGAIATLEQLMASASPPQLSRIKKEIAILRAGIRAEKEAAYLLDFEIRDLKNFVLIHDLRIEHGGRVAQIDHLLINRLLDFYILETKHFNTGLKVDEQGQFLRWNSYQKTYEGMPSPIEQAERQGRVLLNLIRSLDWPTRAGLKLTPTIKTRVLISAAARLILPGSKPDLDASVMKADMFAKNWKKETNNRSILEDFTSVTKVVGRDTLYEMARKLIACHLPLEPDYATKFGQAKTPPSPASTAAPIATATTSKTAIEHSCRHCKSTKVEMLGGKFGYYFKCQDCSKNTRAPSGCDKKDCTSKIRKEGAQFTLYCDQCNLQKLLHENAAVNA